MIFYTVQQVYKNIRTLCHSYIIDSQSDHDMIALYRIVYAYS